MNKPATIDKNNTSDSSSASPASSTTPSSLSSSSTASSAGGSLRGLGSALRQLQQHQRKRNFLTAPAQSSPVPAVATAAIAAAAATATTTSTMLLTSAHDHHLNFVMGFIKEDEIYNSGNSSSFSSSGGGGIGDGSGGTASSSIVSTTTDTSSEDNSLVVPTLTSRLLDSLNDDNKQINHNASPFRRWGQSSLRSRSGEQRTPGSSHRRPSSLAASESDVYTKSIDDDYSSTKSGYNPYADAAAGGSRLP
ncbi:homeotic protein ocelliless-like [Topomyia yanbarensis]|uniref:homeotic protein ocelliless-like n=1 Tax=Topomyia yanbarensis TaxID=2498891 RepID=UPI00273AD71E|nr:homeotic protein ocelliless-like [Topomyia yanbarensis]